MPLEAIMKILCGRQHCPDDYSAVIRIEHAVIEHFIQNAKSNSFIQEYIAKAISQQKNARAAV